MSQRAKQLLKKRLAEYKKRLQPSSSSVKIKLLEQKRATLQQNIFGITEKFAYKKVKRFNLLKCCNPTNTSFPRTRESSECFNQSSCP